jgi:pyrroloquinoline quinone biosynthesis protein B
MHIRILGSAAGGGVPQWNCRCANCELARAGSPRVRRRTQSSVAVSADGRTWFLLNVSPDIRQQILATPVLGPPEGQERGTAIAGCVLTDAELDHTAGLLFLREGGPLTVWSTATVRRWLNRFLPVEPLLCCFSRPAWVDLPLDRPIPLSSAEGPSPGLRVRAFEIERHIPRFVPEMDLLPVGSVIGLLIEDVQTSGKLLYAPCVGSLSEPLVSLAKEVDAILIDGTFWSNEEPLRFGDRTALQMGHLPVGGLEGSLSWLLASPARHRVYLHINNTNPMLNEANPEYQTVAGAGVTVGGDGDAFEL